MKRKLKEEIKSKLSPKELADITENGADRGVPGFTTIQETTSFYKRHRPAIVKLVEKSAKEVGKSPVEFVRGFRLIDFTDKEIVSTMYGSVVHEQVATVLTWFALESLAVMTHPEAGQKLTILGRESKPHKRKEAES